MKSKISMLPNSFSHLRRKLLEVMDVAPKGTVIKETQTYKMYQMINKLFYLEKVYDKKYKKDYDRITKERKIKSLPVLEEFYEIVKTVAPHTPKKSYYWMKEFLQTNGENIK